jgi:hypothetical protein
MSQLALDDVERDALPGHLDSVGVSQLVRSKAPPTPAWTAVRRSAIRTCEPDQGRPQVGPLITQKSGPTGNETRASSQGRS